MSEKTESTKGADVEQKDEEKIHVQLRYAQSMAKMGIYKVHNDSIYQWGHSCYVPVDKATLRRNAWNWLMSHAKSLCSESLADSLSEALTLHLSELEDSQFHADREGYSIVPLKRKTLRVTKTGDVQVFDSDRNIDPQTYHIDALIDDHLPYDPRNYMYEGQLWDIPEVPQDSKWMQFLNSSIPDKEVQNYLAQWVGLSLTPRIDGKTKAVWLLGEGGNGKSIFIKCVEALHNKDRVAAMNLDKLNEQTIYPAVNASLVTCADTGVKISEDEFKKCTSGDSMQIKMMYKDRVTVRLTAKWLISSNNPPIISDKTRAIYRRIQFINFNQTISEEMARKAVADLGGIPLEDHLIKNELHNVLFWALKGLRQLIQNGYNFPQLSSSDVINKEVQVKNNTALDFMLERKLRYIDNGNDPRSLKDDVYAAYEEFCDSQGHHFKLAASSFWRAIKQCFKEEYKMDVDTEGKQARIQGKIKRVCHFVVDSDLPNEILGQKIGAAKSVIPEELIDIGGKKFRVKMDVQFEGEPKYTLEAV